MKLPPFRYGAPTVLGEAIELLAEHGDEAAVLAGGQSLLLELRYRQRMPKVLVDLNAVSALDRVSVPPIATASLLRASGLTPAIEVGALVRHADLEALGRAGDPASGPLGRLIGLIAPLVGHPPIRARGTFAGSIAWAHPSAEWCALAALVDAVVVVHGSDDERQVPAADWFVGRHRTACRPDEVITRVRLPLLDAGSGIGFVEHRRTHGTFALVAALAAVRLGFHGQIREARLALAGAADVPVRARAVEAGLVGAVPNDHTLRAAVQLVNDDTDPVPEPHCSPEYRRHAVRVVAQQALSRAVVDARLRRPR
jgi:carbon-monoxide dehydrogenase medium subunit